MTTTSFTSCPLLSRNRSSNRPNAIKVDWRKKNSEFASPN
jgi:hypothetical protein